MVSTFGTCPSGTWFRQTGALVELHSDWLSRFYPNPGQRRFAELFLLKLLKWTVIFFFNELYRCRGNTLTMCEFHESSCNGFRDIWWTDNPIYFSSIDVKLILFGLHLYKSCL